MILTDIQINFGRKVIGSTVRNLVQCGKLPANEQAELRDALMCDLVEAWPAFDPHRGTDEAFINTVVSSRTIDHLRGASALKRCRHCVSIEDAAEALTAPKSIDDRIEDAIDLRIDLEEAEPQLSEFDRRIVGLLKRDPLTHIADDLDMARSTLRDKCSSIKSALKDAGLDVYLR